MGVVNLNVHIRSASGIGGKYPFVVCCFDNNIKSELFKTEAVQGGRTAKWDYLHAIDFSAEMQNLQDAGKPEPTYLTFFIFDTGVPGVPSLGSAGVLLKTVQESGMAQGQFPIISGNPGATLDISVTYEKVRRGQEGFLNSNAAKIGAGVGVAALATGLAALAINQTKKKKKKKSGDTPAKKKKSKWPFAKSSSGEGTRSIGEEHEGEEAEEGEEEEEEKKNRPWWDPTTSSSSSEEEDDEEEEEEADDDHKEDGNKGGDDDDAGKDDGGDDE